MVRLCSSAMLLLTVLWTAPGRAGEGSDTERAEKLFAESAEAYKAGRFERAIELLEEAHRLTGEPVLLFNLAKAHEGRGDLPKAIEAYDAYLRDAKLVPDRGAIEERLKTLRAQVASRSELEKKAEAERLRAERAERDRPSPSPVPWVLAGVGVAGLVTGAALGVVAKGKEEDAGDAANQVEASDIRDEAERFALGANVAFGIGGAVLTGAIIWGIVDVVVLSGGAEDGATARILVEPTGLRFVATF
ncbi:MAG: hypothetical protein JNL21_16745 [Myxococcales bacterium]|nr:hypothetical protein [Myxococcales bacterium]